MRYMSHPFRKRIGIFSHLSYVYLTNGKGRIKSIVDWFVGKTDGYRIEFY